jgi:putative transcription factor
MNCELCGQKPAVYHSEIEGTMMNVCVDCAKFGVTKKKTNIQVIIKEKRPEEKEPIFLFVQGYGSIVKKAREKLGLKQEEMAKRLNERESFLHQIESESLKPRIEIARKLERELKIKIIEELKDSVDPQPSNSKSVHSDKDLGLTLGDFIKHKKKS